MAKLQVLGDSASSVSFAAIFECATAAGYIRVKSSIGIWNRRHVKIWVPVQKNLESGKTTMLKFDSRVVIALERIGALYDVKVRSRRERSFIV